MQEQAKKKPILITTQQPIRDGEIVQIQMYVDTPDEMADAVKKASAAIKVRKDEFQQELLEANKAAEAERLRREAEKNNKKGAK